MGALSDRFGLDRAVLVFLRSHSRRARVLGATEDGERDWNGLLPRVPIHQLHQLLVLPHPPAPDPVLLSTSADTVLQMIVQQPRPTPRRASCTEESCISTSAQ